MDAAGNARWLRYYGNEPPWNVTSYYLAMDKPAGYYQDKIVFIGNKPKTTINDREPDKFMRPYTRWTGELAPGLEIHATSFLNLVNNESIVRFPLLFELAIIVVLGAGIAIAGMLLRPALACAAGAIFALLILIMSVLLTHNSQFWFPWLVVAGGQVPCAVLCSFGFRRLVIATQSQTFRRVAPSPSSPLPAPAYTDCPPVPEYELVEPPIGQGGFGKVWLARNAIGQWQALKVVSRAGFESEKQYNTEFEGIRKYKPVSEKHPGLLRVELVSVPKPEGWFYYVMELGDSEQAGWQERPRLYRPRTLASMCASATNRRLAIPFCLEMGINLAETLEFLHSNNLTHRDIKPANVIFVNGKPKLADVGLVTDVRRLDIGRTRVGTPGYMPPAPEPPGTPQADIYGLGMLLYVISTGRSPETFPKLSPTLVDDTRYEHFQVLDPVLIKACEENPNHRYAVVKEMKAALQKALEEVKSKIH